MTSSSDNVVEPDVIGISTPDTQGEKDINYYSDKENNVNIVAVKKDKYKLELNYDENRTLDIKDVSTQNNFEAAINGSYFLENFVHAGLLIVNGVEITSNAPSDKQLSEIIILNNDSNDITFVKAAEFETISYLQANTTAFQTGPIVVQNGILSEEYINNSLNGSTKHKRTLLGFDEDEIFFISTSSEVSLIDLGNLLLSFNIWDSGISIINLDGGSSVSMYSKDQSVFNYGTFKVLPIILGFKLQD